MGLDKKRDLYRWMVFAPAAVLALSAPVQADTFSENFDDDSYDLSVQLGQNARWCTEYSDQYGTSGPSLCLFGTTSPTVFGFPDGIQVQGFQFIAGAKNGTTELEVSYSDGTSEGKPIDGSCCETTVSVVANEGRSIVGFSVPADWDLWLFDSLEWWGEVQSSTTTSTSPPETTTSTTEVSTTVPETTTTLATVPAPAPVYVPDETTTSTTEPVPQDTQTTVGTVAPTTTYHSSTTIPTTTVPETTVPSTTPPSTDPPAPQETVPLDVAAPDQQAPYEEKKEFESKVDVYSGEYEDYVPAGSTITVAQRRTVVAVTAVLVMFAPPPTRQRRR